MFMAVNRSVVQNVDCVLSRVFVLLPNIRLGVSIVSQSIFELFKEVNEGFGCICAHSELGEK